MSTEQRELHLRIGEAIARVCLKHGVPAEAIKRLATPEGEPTLETFSRLVQADYEEPPQTPLVQIVERPSLEMLPSAPDPANIILVPDLDAVTITALAKRQCKLNYLDRDYEKWDYLISLDKKPISGRGRRFEVLTWKPNWSVSSDEVRKYFQKKGSSGHTAAFTAWVAQHSPEGYHASIPEDSGHASRSPPNGGRASDRDRRSRKTARRGRRRSRASRRWCFVAFREL